MLTKYFRKNETGKGFIYAIVPDNDSIGRRSRIP
jgi:hypothetical protein